MRYVMVSAFLETARSSMKRARGKYGSQKSELPNANLPAGLSDDRLVIKGLSRSGIALYRRLEDLAQRSDGLRFYDFYAAARALQQEGFALRDRHLIDRAKEIAERRLAFGRRHNEGNEDEAEA